MRIVILGAGGFGQTAGDAAEQCGLFSEVCYLDDGTPKGVRLLGRCSDFSNFIDDGTAFLPAVGDNALRLEWLDRLSQAGAAIATVIHPRAYVSPRASLGEGSILLPMALVNTGTSIGRGCIINCGAMVDHGCVIEDGCHICLGAIVKGGNRIKALTKVEAGIVIERGAFPVQ